MAGAGWSGLLEALDRHLIERRFAAGQREPTGRIVLVDIDARSLAEVGVWPWPRRLYGELLRSAVRAGAARVAFDIDFSVRSNPGDDEAFGSALAGAGVETFLAAFAQSDTAANLRTRVSLPIGELLRSSWPAAVNVLLDPDGRLRRLPNDITSDGETLTSLPSLLADRSPSAGRGGIDFSIAAERIPRASFVDLLHHRIAPDALAGKTLLVGASAVELHDLFVVPAHGTVSGSTVLALAAETLLQGRELRFGDLPWWALGLFGAVGWLALRQLRPGRAALVVATLVVLVEALAFVLQHRFAVAPTTAGVHALLACLLAARLLREFDLHRMLRWLAETRSRNHQNILERVIDDGFDGIVIFDEALRVTRANREARTLLDGIAPGALTCSDHLPTAIAEDLERAIAAFRSGSPSAKAAKTVELVGSDRILEYTVAPFWMTPLNDAGHAGERPLACACLTLRDVTERERTAERVRFLALHDNLTGLGNRHSLEQRLEALPSDRTGAGRALLSFDLDRFKAINDSLGHGIGDRVLAEVAERARTLFGDDGHLFRLGGDEFAALLPGADESEACRKGTELVAAIAEPFLVGGHRVGVGASVGVAWWGDGGETASSAMRRSDVALYRAKRSTTRKVVVFEPSMDADRLARLAMERDLLHAFDAGEFQIAYQPQIHLRSGEAVGAEALLRWRQGGKGFISPALFIPVAEEMGLIHRLGAFAMEAACREAAGWPEPLKVAVNVSALQLSAGDLVRTVESALSSSSLPPERLELEITESAFVDDGPGLTGTFDALRAMGIRFALDDFGTGYSSLGYLHRFPISKLKIDRSFVTGVPEVGSSMAVLRSIMALADGLGIRTIAEGIEKAEEAETLQILGCDDGQGYLFGKPLSIDGFAEWRRAGNRVRCAETNSAAA